MASADLVGWSTHHHARPATGGDTPFTWQVAALTAYALEAGAESVHLHSELAVRVQALTGWTIPDRAITADGAVRRATAVVDGVVFQLRGHDLSLLRPCAHCGTGHFASPALASRADLGYVLSGWQPYHAGCEPADLADTGC
jgi:hypothetical protein